MELFLDPNRFSKDGTAALSATAFSESGKLYAYGISRSGSDWFTVYIRQTESTHAAATDTTSDSGRLDDVVRFVKYSGITWSHDDKGFWYQSLPPKVNQGSETDDIAGTETGGDRDAELMYHRIGTSQDEDILVHKDPENPHNMFGTEVTDDGKYLIMSTSKDTSPTAKTYIVPLEKLDLSGKQRDISQSIPWQKIKDDFEGSIDYIANNDSKFWWQTNRDAPKSKIVTFDLDKPQEASLQRHIMFLRLTELAGLHRSSQGNARRNTDFFIRRCQRQANYDTFERRQGRDDSAGHAHWPRERQDCLQPHR